MDFISGAALVLFILAVVGVTLWWRPRDRDPGSSPEREGTSYEKPQDEGAGELGELEGQEPIQDEGRGPGPPD